MRHIEVVDHEDGSITLEHRIDNDLAGAKEITADEVDAIIDALALPEREDPHREVRVERKRMFVDDATAWVQSEHGSETILVPASPEPDKETP